MKDDRILLAHGGGGRKTQSLIQEVMLRHFRDPVLARLDDAARLEMESRALAFTTDSYVVDPPFFPGGDIGKLAACGTINDLAMQAATPKFMSVGLILEEGFLVSDLNRALGSLAAVTRALGVVVATGDTKVVERGRGGGIFVNTSGIGIRPEGLDIGASRARPGDAVLVSGTIGDHGIAVMSVREGLAFETPLQSDVAPLWPLVAQLLEHRIAIHCLRDPTRGGLAAALCDVAAASDVGVRIREADLPVRREVRAACGLLGLDPLHVANEGKLVLICAAPDAPRALAVLREHSLGRDAAIMGQVEKGPKGVVRMETVAGGERVVEMPLGDELPRIC